MTGATQDGSGEVGIRRDDIGEVTGYEGGRRLP